MGPKRSYKRASLIWCCCLIATLARLWAAVEAEQYTGLLVMTVASNPDNDSFRRFNRSLATYGLELVVLSSNEASLKTSRNELQLYRKALASYKNEQQLAVMLVDGNKCILNGNQEEILKRFRQKFDKITRLVLSADSKCWPDPSLGEKYPQPANGGHRYLNSRALIGQASALYELLTSLEEDPNGGSVEITSMDLLQSLFTRAYLDESKRKRFGMALDHRAELFQSVGSSESDVELEFDSSAVKLKNPAFHTEPVVVVGTSKASRVVLNSLGNYLANAWTLNEGCRHCNESMQSLAKRKDHELPSLLMGLFIEEPTPFLDDFFQNLIDLNYPRDKIHLFVHSQVAYHDQQLQKFLLQTSLNESATVEGPPFASSKVIKSYESINETTPGQQQQFQMMAEWEARDLALSECLRLACDYYLSLDSVAHLDLNDTLRHLIEANKPLVAPLLSRPTKLWSNFWGSITDDGYYARSHDYVSLVKRDRMGLWDVPFVMNAYLVEARLLKDLLNNDNISDQQTKLTYRHEQLKPVLAFGNCLRELNVHQYMLNTYEFGHLIDPSSYNISLKRPDFYQLRENVLDWERYYIHDNYSQQLELETKLEQPCQDVFWFPLVNDLFATHILEIMEDFGQWSGGQNHDPRIEGGYESVPTRDIHMRQVGLHDMWLHFIREYVMPIQLKEFVGYEHDPPTAALAFVVRYHPEEQPSLRPHHDASTYTLNIALNEPGTDYQGGGCRFVRYNCSVTQSRKGWALIHPGRLTHYHEGLPVTNGTRYIMVTFVDP